MAQYAGAFYGLHYSFSHGFDWRLSQFSNFVCFLWWNAVNLSGALFWVYCTHKNRLTDHKLNPKFAKKIALLHLSPCVLYLIAVLFSAVSSIISYIIFIGVPVFFIVPNGFLRRLLAKAYDQ
jgi:hypothetical protein